jgi:hypothetical protein
VFLRKDSDRISKLGKEFKIPKHWAHFNSTSEEQKAACEARVSSYTEADRQRIQSQARGQRLKLIHRKFWLIWGNWNKDLVNEKDRDTFIKILENPIKDLFLGQYKDWTVSTISHGLKTFKADDTVGKGDEVLLATEAWPDLKGLDAHLHAKIATEIGEFLFSRKAEPVIISSLATCLCYILWNELIEDEETVDREEVWGGILLSLYRGDYRNISETIATRTLDIFQGSVLRVPWASEFARLEAEAGQKVAA